MGTILTIILHHAFLEASNDRKAPSAAGAKAVISPGSLLAFAIRSPPCISAMMHCAPSARSRFLRFSSAQNSAITGSIVFAHLRNATCEAWRTSSSTALSSRVILPTRHPWAKPFFSHHARFALAGTSKRAISFSDGAASLLTIRTKASLKEAAYLSIAAIRRADLEGKK